LVTSHKTAELIQYQLRTIRSSAPSLGSGNFELKSEIHRKPIGVLNMERVYEVLGLGLLEPLLKEPAPGRPRAIQFTPCWSNRRWSAVVPMR
jgi:hypothetical protein